MRKVWAGIRCKARSRARAELIQADGRWSWISSWVMCKKKLRQNEYKEVKSSGTSSVWTSFMQIVDKDNKKVSAVKCITCDALLKFDSAKTGTSHLSVGKREEQSNMDGNLLAKRIASHAVSEKATKLTKFFFGCSRVCVFPAGFGSNFWIMVGSASGPGSTFKAFLVSARVRVPLSNKIRVRVGSVQHIYGSLRVRVRILGPVKTSTVNATKSEGFHQ